ncbi:MAG: hypothetical protein M0C28_12920 [Candidatus Moduliflexus flocculans]|nr:hypothetical protein [Candidatus Moduliflexus flocculans]
MSRSHRSVKDLSPLPSSLVLGLAVSPALAQQKVHEEYTKKIREFTTDPHFATKYVDYLPYAEGVPTPLEVLGRIAGAKDVLSYTSEIYKYMRALAAATPRVKVFDIGKTEEGRDWIVVAVADEETIRNLDKYKEINAQPGRSPQAVRRRGPSPSRPGQAHLLGHRRPALRRDRHRPRCSWSWPTASPSTSRPSSRPSARTPSRSSPRSSSRTAATSRSTSTWPSARTPRPTSPTGSSTGASTSPTTTTATTSAWPSSSARTS